MIGFIIEATVALLILYAFFRAYLAQESMFRFNRFFLLFALCFSLIVPLLQLPFGLRVTESLFPQNPFDAIPSSVEVSPKEVPSPQLVAEPGETEISPQSQPTKGFRQSS